MKKIKKLKDGLLSRQFGIAKIAIKTGKDFIFSKEGQFKDKLRDGLSNHVDSIVSELGVMKGSLMKAGQMLSTYAGAILPPEAQNILKSLESESNYLDWEQISKNIPSSWLEEVEIDHTPIAAASLGQVHLVHIDGLKFVMKIQYSGVRKAIKNDIRALKLLLKALNVIPKEIDLKDAFIEIETMLRQETDYKCEVENTKMFKELLSPYGQFVVPTIIDKYSNEDIITSQYIDGHSLHDIQKLNLNNDQVNYLGREFMRLLFLEIFVFKKVQTDVHPGNYFIMKEGNELKWGLIDFGASKAPPADFITQYQNLLISCANLDKELFFETLYKMNYLSREKKSNEEFLWEYANVISEPFQTSNYNWGKSDVADRVINMIPRFIKEVKVGNPPSHSIFLDRKIGGVFFMLQKLGAQFDARSLLDEYIE